MEGSQSVTLDNLQPNGIVQCRRESRARWLGTDLHPRLLGFGLDFFYLLFLLGYVLTSCRHVAFIRFYVHQGENAMRGTYLGIYLFSAVKINKPSLFFFSPRGFYCGYVLFRNCIQNQILEQNYMLGSVHRYSSKGLINLTLSCVIKEK